MDIGIWSLLHDGKITDLVGGLPGTVTVSVSIPYLSELLSTPGDRINVFLSDCTLFEFHLFHEGSIVRPFDKIVALDLEILSAELGHDSIEIFCPDGSLLVRYRSATYSLADGRSVTLDEIDKASKEYWDNFPPRGKR
ncbi:MAG: hypothetical protein KDD64_06600 [Bdellovibrionales bacterium]|nr:hypothetical protein [Bdellovibrionales bacterium]